MTTEEKAIFTNMCMVCDEKGNILVQERTSADWPGVTLPGGHVKVGESSIASVIREVREETGLTIENPVLCGIKQFQATTNARYIVLFFRANEFTGSLTPSKEGRVFWVKPQALASLPLATDMTEMVRVFESDALSEYYCYREDGEWRARLL